MELQRLLQQINSPEFQEAMKKMQQAMQNVSPDQLRQAMQQVQFSEEAFRESIDRTVQLLKRIQVEQKMDEMVKRANELQHQQENLQKETAETPPSHQVDHPRRASGPAEDERSCPQAGRHKRSTCRAPEAACGAAKEDGRIPFRYADETAGKGGGSCSGQRHGAIDKGECESTSSAEAATGNRITAKTQCFCPY